MTWRPPGSRCEGRVSRAFLSLDGWRFGVQVYRFMQGLMQGPVLGSWACLVRWGAEAGFLGSEWGLFGIAPNPSRQGDEFA